MQSSERSFDTVRKAIIYLGTCGVGTPARPFSHTTYLSYLHRLHLTATIRTFEDGAWLSATGA